MRESEADEVQHCDLVMKGGITSGVIYPRLVAGLARRYVFKNIGGTSAGAIAAGASAAAELGRQRGHAAAFELLSKLPEELGQSVRERRGDPGRSRLLTLFQPVPALRRHFEVLMRGLGKPAGKAVAVVVGGIVATHWAVAAAVAGIGALLLMPYARLLAPEAGLAPWQTAAVLAGMAVVASLTAAVAVVSTTVLFARDLLRGFRDNGYGLCSGLTQPGQAGQGGQTALTDWLHGYFNQLAGKSIDGPPLSFGDLWGPDPAARRIHLEVMTSAVSQQMVYSIPFREGTPTFYYDPNEWARLFPAAVMDALQRASDRIAGDFGAPTETAEGAALRPLPRGGDLPVVVAIRMSLSFPLLLSAVPLYAVDWSLAINKAREAAHRKSTSTSPSSPTSTYRVRATKIWFSDGGIGSNMPLHMFDALLPRHPGFAINLKAPHPDFPIVGDETGASANAENAGGRIYLASNNRGGRLQHWPEPDLVSDWSSLPAGQRAKGPAQGLASFLWSIVGTMQNWRDQMAFPTPGLRDRIVQISLRADEGGLNLRMSNDTIGQLAQAGRMAADRLIGRFHPAGRDAGAGWRNQRRVRLTTFLGVMQPAFVDLARIAGPTGPWLLLLRDASGYKGNRPNRREAERFLDGLVTLGQATPPMRGSTRLRSLGDVSPRPVPLVRLVPKI